MKKGQKLTEENKNLIRWLVGVNQYELAQHFGIRQSAISQIQSGKDRKYGIEKELDFFHTKEARVFARRRGKPIKYRKKRSEYNTRKTGPGFAKKMGLVRSNPNWQRSIEQFREYHKRPDALYHAKLNSLKTHCKRRHPLSGDNVYIQLYKGKVMRRCVTCWRLYQRERYAAHKKQKQKSCWPEHQNRDSCREAA